MEPDSKILIVHPFGIGDVLFSTPILKAIKEHAPGSYIAFMCNRRSREILINNPHIDDIVIFEKDELRELWQKSKLKFIYQLNRQLRRFRKGRFDIMIDFSLTHIFSATAMLIGIGQRVGFNYKQRGRFLTDRVYLEGYTQKHVVEYYIDLLKFLDVPCEDKELILRSSGDDMKYADNFSKEHRLKNIERVIGVMPGGGASWGDKSYYKHWPLEYFNELIQKILGEKNAKIILFGGYDDRHLCHRLCQSNRDVINACGTLTLNQLAAMLRKCDLVFANDGGPLHIATSQDVKTISFFGPVNPVVYGPFPRKEIHRVLIHDVYCRPCYSKFRVPDCLEEHTCLRSITPAIAFEEYQKLIELKYNRADVISVDDEIKPVNKPMSEVKSVKEAQEVQRNIYNRSFKEGAFCGVVADLSYEMRINFALRHATGKQSRVLDLGSGDGTIDRGVLRIAREIIGIDISNRAINLADSTNDSGRIKYINMAIEDYNSVEKFDLVMMYEIIEHVYNARAVLQKVREMLTDNGVLVLSTPNYLKLIRRVKSFWPIRRLRELIGKKADRVNFDHFQEFKYEEMKEILEGAGFEIIDRRGVIIWTNTIGGDALRNCKWIQRLNFDCGKLFPDVAGDMYIAARKVRM